MNSKKQIATAPWPLVILFFILSAGEIFTGYLYYRSQENNLLDDSIGELSAIAKIKVRQISQWRNERIADGAAFSQNSTILRQFSQFLKDENNMILRTDLINNIKALIDIDNYDYRSAVFMDRDHRVKLVYPDQDTIIGEYPASQLEYIIRTGDISITDLHLTDKVSFRHLDLLVPLRNPESPDKSVFGILILRIDPERTLFSFIRLWPLTSKTSEAYLIRREGDEVAYLNTPGYSENTGTILKRSMTEEDLVDVMALQGITETTSALDYRGIRVIAAMDKVPHLPWYIVAKVDHEEILSSLPIQIRQVQIIIILFLVTTALLLGALWWTNRVRFYRSMYEAELEHIALKKFSEQILKESEEKFRKIFEDSPFPMLMADKDFGIIKVNSAFCKMLGYTEDELVGLTYRNFTHPDYINNDEIQLMRLVSDEIPIYHTEKRYIKRDGNIIWGSTTVSIIRNNKDEVQFFLAMVEDITARKTAEAELIAAKEKAEESDKLKTAFLHNVSHEIRTPMNAILGFSALMSEPGITDSDRNQYIDIIFQSGNQLLTIINDIVDLAGIESGQVKINIREININTVLKELCDQFTYKLKSQHITLHYKASLPNDDAEILTDGTRLIQILSNLINNAFKFTKTGRIDFGYNLKDDLLEFFVKDTGIGIPAEYHSLVFERFYQVDSAVSRQYTGTGLGLSICKAFAGLLGGNIWLTSRPGVGSTFYFTIPYVKKEKDLSLK